MRSSTFVVFGSNPGKEYYFKCFFIDCTSNPGSFDCRLFSFLTQCLVSPTYDLIVHFLIRNIRGNRKFKISQTNKTLKYFSIPYIMLKTPAWLI